MTDGVFRFTARDIEDWARFSGDFNPAHFDDGFARSLGLPGRIVHGMLAMLELKRRIDDVAFLDRRTKGGWWSCECLLRAPVPLGSPARFKAGVRRDEHTFSLNVLDGPKAITGVLRAVAPATPRGEALATDGTARTVTEAQIQRRLHELKSTHLNMNSGWIAADALLFSILMGLGIHQPPRPPAPNPGGDGSRTHPVPGEGVLQTGHDVAFESDFFGAGGEGFAPRPLEIDTLEPESRTVAGNTHLTRRWQVRHRNRVVMKTEVRLVLLMRHSMAPEGSS